MQLSSRGRVTVVLRNRRLFGIAGVMVAAVFVGVAAGQRAPYQPAPGSPAVATAPAKGPAEPVQVVYVDQRCRVLPDPAVPGKKAKARLDPEICRLEAVYDTERDDQKVVGFELQRSEVEIYEQQYVLHNPTSDREVFVVEQALAKGWTIESDPPPERVAGMKAYFRVWVGPDETVRLHVGLRHEKSLKPRVLKAEAGAPPGSPTAPPP